MAERFKLSAESLAWLGASFFLAISADIASADTWSQLSTPAFVAKAGAAFAGVLLALLGRSPLKPSKGGPE